MGAHLLLLLLFHVLDGALGEIRLMVVQLALVQVMGHGLQVLVVLVKGGYKGGWGCTTGPNVVLHLRQLRGSHRGVVNGGLEQGRLQEVPTLAAVTIWRVQVTRSGCTVVHSRVTTAARARSGGHGDKGIVGGGVVVIWQRFLLLSLATSAGQGLVGELLLGIKVSEWDLLGNLLVVQRVVGMCAGQVGLVQGIWGETVMGSGRQVVLKIGSGDVVLVLLLSGLELLLLLGQSPVVCGRHYNTIEGGQWVWGSGSQRILIIIGRVALVRLDFGQHG